MHTVSTVFLVLNLGWVFLWVLFQVLMMGEPFFDCQIGFVGCRALCLKSIMGVRDFEENMNRREEVNKVYVKDHININWELKF